MPTTDAKADANRRNAKHSTGPRTDAGKAVTAMNARTHGILSEAAPVLPTEDAAAFAQLRERMHQDAAPVGVLEESLVERLVTLLWRMRRLAVAEAALFAWHQAHAARLDGRSPRLDHVKP